jgi:cell division protein FtsZ
MAQPAKVFSFPGRTGTATLSVAPTMTPTITSDSATGTGSTLELTEDDDTDELLLDGDDILTQPVGSVPVGPPADDEPSIEEAGNPATEVDKPKIAPGGGTLFERMSNIARGAAQAESQDGEPTPSFRREPLDIPRFLNRQNNQ